MRLSASQFLLIAALTGGLSSCTDPNDPVAGPPAMLEIVSGDAQSGVAGAELSQALVIRVLDANGNTIAGQLVNFKVTKGNGSLFAGSALTNSSGVAQERWTLGKSTADSQVVEARAVDPNTGVGIVFGVFRATALAGPATAIAPNAGNNQTATVGSAVSVAPVVIVKDANENPVAGVAVAFAVASGGGSITGGSVTTNASGIATVGSWTLGTTAGANTLSATATGLSGSPVSITATGTAGAATTIAINAGGTQTATVATAVAISPAVKVTDAHGNAVSGIAVTFAVASGGGSITAANATTNTLGVAAVGSWTLGTTAGANTVTATSTGLTGSPITFTGTGVAGSATAVALNAGNNQSATAGTTVTTAPSVKITDAHGNGVASVSVTFAVASGGGSITGANATTNSSGIAAVGSWTLGPTVGPNTLTGTVTGLSGSPVSITATATAGSATTIAVSEGNNQTATAGAAVAFAPAVKVTDANENAVSGAAVTFAVASGGGSITAANATTNSLGVATVGSWTLGTTAGPNTLTATAAGLSGSPITFSATGAVGRAAAIVIVAGNNQTATAGTLVGIRPSVKVTDANGNGVGAEVVFNAASGGGSGVGGRTFTDANGVATVGGWRLGHTAGPNTLTATATETSLNPVTLTPVTFTATGVAGAAQTVDVNSGNNQSATVGTAVTTAPSVKVTDTNENPVANVPVSFAVVSGGGSITGANATTNASGIATVGSWTLGSTAGANSLTATVTGLTPATIKATGTPGTGTPARLAFKAAIPTWGWRTVAPSVEVVVLDQFSNQVSSTTSVELSLVNNPGGATLSGGGARAAVNGTATFSTLMLSEAGTGYTLMATDPSGTLAPATSNAFAVTPIAVLAPQATRNLVLVGSTIYFSSLLELSGSSQNGLSKVAVNGGAATRVALTSAIDRQAGRMLSDGTYITTMHTIGSNASILRRLIADPSQTITIPLGDVGTRHDGGWNMEFDGTYFYAQFTNNCTSTCSSVVGNVIARIHPLQGPTVLVNDNVPFTVSGGYLYYPSGTTIQRMPTAGGPSTTVVSGVGTVVSEGWRTIIVVGNTLYWTETNGTLRSAPIDGSGSATTRVSGRNPSGHQAGMTSMVSDGTYLYVNDGGSLRRFELGSFTVKTIVDDDGVGDIAVDGEAVYWTSNFPTRQIKKTAK